MRADCEDAEAVLSGGGKCGELMRSIDWSGTALGPVRSWPQSLRTVVGVMLGSRQPMLIVWGPERLTLYNDGYAAMCGKRHPRAMGRPFQELWFDLWDVVEPILDRAYAGVSTHMDDIEFTMHRNGYPEETHFAFSYTPVRVENGEVGGMFCACTETTGAVIARREAAAERARLKLVFEHAPGFIALTRGPAHVFEWANPAYLRWVGDRPVFGRPMDEVLPEAMEQGVGTLMDSVYRTGESVSRRGARYVLSGPGAVPTERFVDFVCQPFRDRAGETVGVLIQGRDVTDRVAAEQQRLDLLREMAHRMKNSMTMVQAVVTQTLRQSANVEDARHAISGRIAALGRAQDILTQADWDTAEIGEVIRVALGGMQDGRDRFSISGPALVLTSQQALGLSLTLHELATNATKYGALSVEDGRVAIAWDGLDGAFRFTWTEAGGPPVTPPSRKGFGTRLVQRIVAPYFNGEADMDFAAGGLCFRLRGQVNASQTVQDGAQAETRS